MKLLVHIHAFYGEILPELVKCVENLCTVAGEGAVSVWVTYPETRHELADLARKLLPRAELVCLPNRGYDIGPFLDVLSRVNLDDYDYVVKLHTKRDVWPPIFFLFGPTWGGEWRHSLLSFCSTEKAARRTLRAFETNPKLGMVAGSRYIDPSGVGVVPTPDAGFGLLQRLGLKGNRHDCVYGTMFMVRAALMRPFTKLSIADCDEPDPQHPHQITGVACACEWAFANAVSAQGDYYVLPARHAFNFERWQWRLRIKSFVSCERHRR